MKISELKDAPRWLLEAKTSNEDVEIVDGAVVWHSGTWHSGTWYGGVWHSGTWYGGVWHDGTWYNGTWRGGKWLDGTWLYGLWCDGTWQDGTWQDGFWRGGTWLDGTWLDGSAAPRSKYVPLVRGDKISIGCKTKTVKEWDAWFAGIETYDTPRDTEAFKLIYAHYCAAKAFIEALQ